MVLDLSGGLDPAIESVIAERPDNPEVRDAVNVWIESDDCDFAMRIGVEALASEWDAHDIWLDIAFASGRVLNFRNPGERHPETDDTGNCTIRGAGPLKFQCVRPFRLWTVSYKGTAAEITALQLARDQVPENPPETELEFSIEMTMGVPPWVSGTLLPESREVMKGEQGDYMSPRHEQLFKAEGWIRAGDDHWDFTGKGLRIRRRGVRKFQGFWGHCWQSALFPSGRAFGFNIYPPRDDMPNFNEGFVFDGRERIPARAVEVPWLDRLQVRGDDVSFVLETIEGDRIPVQGTTFINTRSIYKGQTVLPADFPIVQQAHARYRWDGEETCGMVERSSRPDLITYRE